MTGISVAYATVRMGLRPPRAVVIFDGGDDWTYWVRRAFFLAGRVWGGCGFALVPHRNGQVDPYLLRACRAYDPDFVVVCPRTIGEVEQLRPGTFRHGDGDNQLITGPLRDQLLEDATDEVVPDDRAMAARDLVAAVCSPYRTKWGGDSWDEDVLVLRPGDRGLHDALSLTGVFPGSGLVLSGADMAVWACPPDWGGILGALTASFAGVVENPVPGAAEPELSEAVHARLVPWLLGVPSASAPEALLWAPTEARAELEPTPVAHIRSMAGLVQVTRAGGRGAGLLVVGDEPEDFALARLWQLTFGAGQWLPSSLGVDQDNLPWPVSYAAADMLCRHARESSTLVLTSVSRPTEQLARVHERLRGTAEWQAKAGDRTVEVVAPTGLGWRQARTTHLGLAEQFAADLPIPIVVDETGARSMATPLPAPIVNTRFLAPSTELTWQVDIAWPSNQMVRGRGLDGCEVFTPERPPWLTWARSSRNGISYQSHRFDLVLSGIPEVNKLARPAVRDLSLASWIEAKGREHHFTTRPSAAGHRTNLMARMLGGRRQFVDLFSGPLLPALHALLPTSSTTNDAYPDHDGVALAVREGVLSFAGFHHRLPDLDIGQLRELLDTVLRAGVLRRGLVLRCGTCTQVQFQPVDKISQTWTCTRCDAPNALSLDAWKKPTKEPCWFYDLHPAGRHLLRDHGDVPALLSAHLAADRANTVDFHDVSELEFVVQDKPKVEVDLITYTDDQLTIAECKSNDRLATNNAEAREMVIKKCQTAAWLRADRLIFATTAPSWADRTSNVIISVINAFDWEPLERPETHLITNLGTTTPSTQIVARTAPVPITRRNPGPDFV